MDKKSIEEKNEVKEILSDEQLDLIVPIIARMLIESRNDPKIEHAFQMYKFRHKKGDKNGKKKRNIK